MTNRTARELPYVLACAIKITKRPAEKLSCILATSITGLLLALILFVATESSFAADATWVGGQGGPDHVGDWNFVEPAPPPGFPGPRFPGETNWDPNTTIPNGSGDTATFESSSTTAVHLSQNTEVNGIVFNTGGDAYTISTGAGLTLHISGVGITNNSSMTQNFVTFGNVFDGPGPGVIVFGPTPPPIPGPGAPILGNSAIAGNVVITNMGGTGNFADGGATLFLGTSNAGNATLIANGGSNGGGGGSISFEDDSIGGTARVVVSGTGELEIGLHSAPGVTIGSIEGDGNVFLGANNLTVGSNNMSTVFSGVMDDEVDGVHQNGSLTKVGTGTLTLAGVNTYTGITTINGGVLSISSDANLGIAPSPAPVADQLTFNGGTLQVTASFALDTNRGITLLGGGGTIGVTAANILSYGGVITGAGSLTKTDTGTLVLSGTNTYAGATAVNAGILNIQNGSALGNTFTGTTVLSGATLQLQGGISVGTEALTINGAGAAGQNGALVNVSGTNNYGGLLTLGADSTISSDSGTLNLTNTGTITGSGLSLTLTGSGIGTISSIIGTGTGTVTKNGTGQWTLSGANTYTGATTVNGGTLAAGAINTLPSQTALTVATGATFDLSIFDQSVGSLAGDGSITLGTATLTTGNNNTSTNFSGVISGSGSLIKTGTGIQTLSGTNTFVGPTTVAVGTLLVDGSLVSGVGVDSGATLGGTGTAAGAVTINDGGILAPGNSPGTAGTFTVGSLSLSNASLLNYDLGTPGVIGLGVNDLTIVRGNLTLDGILNTTALAGFGPGGYRLFNYGGALTDNTLDIGTVPAGFLPSNFIVVTGLPNEVDLLVLAGPPPPSVQFWDGPNTTPNGVIDGGTGNWDNFTTNWTNNFGDLNSSWQNGMAVFAGTAGTVTVTQPIFFTDMEFMTDGYQINQGIRGSLNLIGSPTITTDADVMATINATLNGEGGIIKDGLGTLVLSGANTYLGTTTINAGVLSISSDANLGTAPEAPVADQLTFNGGTLQATASFILDTNRGITLLGGGGTIGVTAANILSYGGVITGAGSLTKTDTGTLVLSGANTYTGATTVNGGTLRAGAINTLPSQTALTVATGATFDMNNFSQSIGSLAGAGSLTLGTAMLTTGNDNTGTDFAGVISGLGGLAKVGTGTQILSGENTYTGGTTISTGTLQLGNGGTSGSIVGDVVDNGTFAINRSDTLTFDDVISGSGAFAQIGSGTTILTAANTYSGGTTISAGTLQLGNGGTSGSIMGDVVNNGTFAINRSDTFTFGGVISGSGAFAQIGTGTTVLTAMNTYTGITTINAGVLSISSDANLGTAPGAPVADQLTFTGGTLQATATFNLNPNRGITLLGVGGTIGVTDDNILSYGGVITGAGSLTKTDTGTQILSGDNTYTGGTIISTGTLQLGNGGTSGSIVGDVLNNGTFAVNRSDTFSFGGVISGAGAFQQLGTGTTVLTGANTYTGPTMVDAGTLLVDGSLAIASAVTVNSGATLGGTGTAAGAVTIADGGILAPGDSPGTPGTFIVGSLSLSNASLLNYELGTPGVMGVNDLTIVNDNLTLDGVLNTTALAGFGPGAYRLFNYGGALTNNTLDIGTVPAGFMASNFTIITGLPNEVDLLVLAGPPPPTVQFWDGPNTRSNGVINGGTGEWNNFRTNWTDASGNNNSSWRNGVAVFAGAAGTVTVTQPIFFAGMEFMTDGYQIDQGVRGSLNLIGSPFITTESGVTATINAALAGAGGITKEGVGTLILNSANTYLGNTSIDAGSLIVDGSIASAQTFVNAGGLLGGSGTIGGDLTNGGIVNPGYPAGTPGTLTVNGNYTQTTGGTLRIEIAGTAPGQFDLLRVGGHASLAGTLQLVRLGNFQLQVGDTVTFLTAPGGVSGTFSTIQNPFISNTLIKAEINILANSVELEGTQGSFTEVACNPNTLAVAKALDSAVGDPRAAGLIEFLDTQPLNIICPELELISPEELAAMFNIGVSLANIQSVNLERRMEDIRAGSSGFSARGFSIDNRVPESGPGLAGPTGPEGKSGPSVMQPTPQNRWGVFVTGLGEFTSVDDTSIAPGYNFSTGGLTFGVDYRVSPNFAIGLTGGYANTNADLVNNGSLDVNGGTIGAYATGFSGGFYFDAAAFGVFNGYDSHRTALLGTASGNTDGQDFNALALAGYDWKRGGLTIGPLASFQYTYVEFDSFTEHGSLAPLSFSNQNAHSTRTALGAKASYDWHAGHVLIRPEIRASWQHEFGDRDYSVVSRFANGAGNSFTVNGPEIGRDSLLIGAGAAVIFNDRVSVYAYYDGELARTNYSSNNVSAGVRVSF